VHKPGKPMGFWAAVSLGIGAMIGAGIFALIGEASVISGSAVYISFLIGGVIALFSGYSLGKLGAKYPSSGGIVEYLTQSYGIGVFTGSMSIILYIAALISLSLIAKTFGNYAVLFFPDSPNHIVSHAFSIGVVVLFVLLNLKGAKDVAIWEKITVAIKFFVLTVLSIVGIIYLKPNLLSPDHYPPVSNIFYSLAITFFAYEGFRVITNAAEDMPNPEKTLPRAMMTSIILVMILYVAVSLAVFGNIPTDEVMAAKEYALAQAAVPIFGHLGYTIVAIAALISTASSINANLYAVTNVTYQLAKDGELPSEFGKPIGHSHEGLIISGILVIILSLLFDLSDIAAIGSIAILFVHTITHIGHLRKISETGASILMIVLATVFSFTAMILAIIYVSKEAEHILLLLLGFVAIAVLTEVVLQGILKRKVKPRITGEN